MPLVVFIAPYIARLVESSLLEVDEGILESANAMGATTFQTIWHFMLPEAAASLVLALTTATIGLLGATAMAVAPSRPIVAVVSARTSEAAASGSIKCQIV